MLYTTQSYVGIIIWHPDKNQKPPETILQLLTHDMVPKYFFVALSLCFESRNQPQRGKPVCAIHAFCSGGHNISGSLIMRALRMQEKMSQHTPTLMTPQSSHTHSFCQRSLSYEQLRICLAIKKGTVLNNSKTNTKVIQTLLHHIVFRSHILDSNIKAV